MSPFQTKCSSMGQYLCPIEVGQIIVQLTEPRAITGSRNVYPTLSLIGQVKRVQELNRRKCIFIRHGKLLAIFKERNNVFVYLYVTMTIDTSGKILRV